MTTRTLNQSTVIVDGSPIDLLIDSKSGELFLTIEGYVSLSDRSYEIIKSRIHKRDLIQRDELFAIRVDKIIRDAAEIVYEPKGFDMIAISETIIADWIIDDNPVIAKAMIKAGTRSFLNTQK